MPSTRAQARTSPPNTPSTPAASIASSDMEFEQSSRGPTPSSISVTEHNDAEMASRSASTPTSPSGEATVQPGDESSHNLLTGERAADFEEEITRVRRDARENVEDSDLDEERKRSVTQEAGAGGQIVEHIVEADVPERTPQESSGAEAAGEHIAEDLEPKREATPVRMQASWVEDAVSSAARNKINSGCHDMLIVLDPNDLAKSYLIDTRVLKNVSEALADLCEQSAYASKDFKHQNRLEHLLFLEFTEAMPRLKAVALDHEREPIVKPKREITAEDVKHEDGPATNSDHRDPSTTDARSADSTSWIKAYHSFFHMLDGRRNHGLSRKDPTSALAQIKNIVRIALEYTAVHKVSSAFDTLLLGYVQDCTLWPAIGKDPEDWLNVGIEIHSRLVFDEAFKHLVGESSSHEDPLEYPTISGPIQERVSQRSRELYYKRMRAEKNLLMLTMSGDNSKRKRPRTLAELANCVTPNIRPIKFTTVNMFREWIAAHVSAFELIDELDEGDDEILKSNICNHENGCNTLAGFYRVIATGGNAYLNADAVCRAWNKDFFGKVVNADVKDTLGALKFQASELVGWLVCSTLKSESKDDLKYLTCVKVDLEDVPWKTEPDAENDEEMEED